MGISTENSTLASEWYYAKNGQQYGPISSREMKQLASQGTIQAGDVVWKDGMPEWRPADEIKGLIPEQEQLPELTPVDESESREPRSRQSRSHRRGLFGPLILILASIPMIAAMFLPWWSLRMRPIGDEKKAKGNWARSQAGILAMKERELDSFLKRIESSQVSTEEDEQQERQIGIRFIKAAKKSRKWWTANLKTGDTSFASRIKELAKQADKDKKLSLKISHWGWSDGCAIMGLIFGLVVLLFTILFLSVPPMRDWSWIMSIIATVMGIIAIIFSLIWVFTAPSLDVKKVLDQGTSIGPWLLLGSGVLFFFVGLFDTIFGISYTVRRSRTA